MRLTEIILQMKISNSRKSFMFLFPRAITFLFVRFQLNSKFFKSLSPNSTKLNFSTNTTKFEQIPSKEEKELYLRLTQTFREKLESKRGKPELFYEHLIKSSILETSKILKKPNPITDIFKTKEIKNLIPKIYIASNHKDIHKLRELYQDFKKLEIADETVYRNFLMIFVKDDVETAKVIYEDMRNNGVLPFMSSLIALLKATMNTPTADYYVREIKDLGLQIVTKNQFHVLLNYYISRKDIRGVQSLWQEISNDDSKNFTPNSYSYVRYIGFLCKNNLLDKAIEALHIMENEGIKPFQREFLCSVIRPLAINDHPQIAWRFLSSYRKQAFYSPNIYSSYYTLILESIMRQNDFNAVRKVFIDMESTGVNINDKAKEILSSIQKISEQKETHEYGLIPAFNAFLLKKKFI